MRQALTAPTPACRVRRRFSTGNSARRINVSASVQTAGRVTQVMGPVVDVEFPPGALPEVLTALKITNPGISSQPDNLTIEVAQHLGENTVRCIAMDTTDGLGRGVPVKN